jgi:hypothetical protein
LIFVTALPLFLIAPRSGAAALTRSGGGLSNFIGFSENVTLGQIGTLKQDDGVVMRVRVEDTQNPRELRWRGVALDEFTGNGWKKSARRASWTRSTNAAGSFSLARLKRSSSHDANILSRAAGIARALRGAARSCGSGRSAVCSR